MLLYREITEEEFIALPILDRVRVVKGRRVVADPQATADAALGFLARSGDWNAEAWRSAANRTAEMGLYGIADKCCDIAAEMERQEQQK